nr:ARM repeat superfamily protein [Tanacetum cinerariifolium]
TSRPVPKPSTFSHPPGHTQNGSKKSFASFLKDPKVHHVIVESFKVIVKGKISIIQAKEVTSWAPDFVDADPSSSEDESDKSMNLNQDWLNDKDAEVVEDSLPHQVPIVSGDPFG